MKNEYSFVDKLQLVYYLFRTKLYWKKARLFRFPIDIRGKQFIDFGLRLTTGRFCRFEAFSSDKNVVMRFGNDIQLNDMVHITAMKNVCIGNHVLIASKVYISDCSHGYYKGINDFDSDPETIPTERAYQIQPVVIEDNVWIGEGVSILPGSVIGRGTIIGANSVVNGVLPPYVIAVGAPARVIKYYNFELKKWQKVDTTKDCVSVNLNE